MTLYTLNAVLALLIVFILCIVVVVDWRNMRPVYRPVLLAVALEHVVFAYAALEARSLDLEVGTRVILAALAYLGVIFTGAFLVTSLTRARRGTTSGTPHRP